MLSIKNDVRLFLYAWIYSILNKLFVDFPLVALVNI